MLLFILSFLILASMWTIDIAHVQILSVMQVCCTKHTSRVASNEPPLAIGAVKTCPGYCQGSQQPSSSCNKDTNVTIKLISLLGTIQNMKRKPCDPWSDCTFCFPRFNGSVSSLAGWMLFFQRSPLSEFACLRKRFAHWEFAFKYV